MRVVVALLPLLACAGPKAQGGPTATDSPAEPLPDHALLRGATLAGGEAVDIEIDGGRIAAIGPAGTLEVADPEQIVDLTGRWLAPAFIDSHVHLAYYKKSAEMAAGGVAAAVDMAAPVTFLATRSDDLRVLVSGPMVTAVAGYPTQSWGSAGFGLECADADAAVAAVDQLADYGADLIKIPLTSGPQLDADAVAAAVSRAHARGLKVASHAVTEEAAAEAAAAGVDILAHMPTDALSDETVAAWADKAAVSTLHAFGGADARENLARLRAAGTTILYGTDFGNTRTPGIDADELDELGAAGLTGAEILAAGTATAAAHWGLDDLGSVEVGKAASLLVLAADPLTTPSTLAEPVSVILDGVTQ